jgi:hypothetical protein
MNQTVHLAPPVAVNRTYLSTLEKGASNPGLEIMAKLGTVLEVEPARRLLRTRDRAKASSRRTQSWCNVSHPRR